MWYLASVVAHHQKSVDQLERDRRNPDRLRRPRWRRAHPCTNTPPGPLFGGRSRTITEVRKASPLTTTEVLTPDFLKKDGALKIVVEAKPDVFNHNLETVPDIYLKIRPGARYFHSLRLLQRVTELDPAMFTKSSIMVGLGEAREQLMQVMDDMRAADIGFISIGTHLQPTRKPAAN